MNVSSASAVTRWLHRLSAFFASHAWLSLFTLLLLLGLVGGLAQYTARLTAPVAAAPAVGSASRSLVPLAAGGRCGQVLVEWDGRATVQQLTQLLQSVDAVVVYGPNENGAFALRVPAADARSIAQALETSPAVRLARVQPDCL